jgi:hypothetical protein
MVAKNQESAWFFDNRIIDKISMLAIDCCFFSTHVEILQQLGGRTPLSLRSDYTTQMVTFATANISTNTSGC